MWCADNIVERNKIPVPGGFFFKNIECSAGDFPGDEGIMKILLIYNSSPGTIDNENAVFHPGKSSVIDHSPCFLGNWSVY